jgi:hypothetical protein
MEPNFYGGRVGGGSPTSTELLDDVDELIRLRSHG